MTRVRPTDQTLLRRWAADGPGDPPVDHLVATVQEVGRQGLDRRVRVRLEECARHPTGTVGNDLARSLANGGGPMRYHAYLALDLLLPKGDGMVDHATPRDQVAGVAIAELRAAGSPTDRRSARSIHRFLERVGAGSRSGSTEVDHRRITSSLLPVTPLPDERLFLRSVQILELSFEHWSDLVERIDTPGPPASAAIAELGVEISAATSVLGALATVRADQFAAIRAATEEASAIHSAGYLRLRAALARLDALVAAGWPSADHLGLQAIDLAHRRWSRQHLALARRLIGDAPGTGGTTGATYLAARAERSVLPSAWGGPALASGPASARAARRR